MNYRHSYHAGNFADVFKHLMLTRIVEYLKRKDKAFRVIDTHAGSGSYVLSPREDGRAEWQDGIARIAGGKLGGAADELAAPYFRAICGDVTLPETLTGYPGSPLIVRRLLRSQDRLSACELHPEETLRLKALFAGDFQVRVMGLDGWLVPGAQLPPKEKRGLLFIDPPFEKPGEFDRLLEALAAADRRWPGGMVALWYPLKHQGEVAGFIEALRQSGLSDILRLEITIDRPADPPVLHGSGLIVRNAPFTLEEEAAILLPELVRLMERAPGLGSHRIERLTPERI